MAWTRIQLTEDEQRIVNEERTSHPKLQVRDKMWTIWLLHCGLTRQKAAEIVGVSRTQYSDTWMPIAKAVWTGYGVRMSKDPGASWPHFVTSSGRHSKNNPSARSPRRATESRS